MNSPTDPLQAQYDGIPVPCYTWRFDGGDFVLERANRAAFARSQGSLEPLFGRRRGDLYPDWPEVAEDFAHAFGELVLSNSHERPPQ